MPFIVRWPGQVPAGKVDDTSVLHVCDLVPTFCKLAGARMPEGYQSDGIDVTDALRGRPFERKAPMFWHHPNRGKRCPALAVRDGKWKLLMDPDGSALDLYNLADDVGEKEDVAKKNPQVVEKLKARLLDWYGSLPKPQPPLR